MADFAPNYTARYKLKYQVGSKKHSMTFRGGTIEIVTGAGFVAGISNFLDALAPQLQSDWTILGADVAAQDSDVFVPATILPAFGEALSAVASTPGTAPRFWSFIGRTGLGNQAKLLVFGVNVTPEVGLASDWRAYSPESSVVANAVASLNDFATLLGPDLSKPTWYPYANFGEHAHYQQKART